MTDTKIGINSVSSVEGGKGDGQPTTDSGPSTSTGLIEPASSEDSLGTSSNGSSEESKKKNQMSPSIEQTAVASGSGEGTVTATASAEVTAISRCLALEQAYVHDVYSEIARECGACSPVRSHIKEFLYDEFELGSLLMDIGCGDGKYLNLKSDVFTLGLEKCPDWFNKDHNVIAANSSNMSDLMVADVIYLPVRDEFFDGVLCCGVLHHISTTDRRVSAIKEMCRVIKIGGKLLITVWAFEGRELESQDVLIKWNSSKKSRDRYGSACSSDDTTSSCSTSSTTTTNYVNRKAAYESCNSPTSQFGTCYSFVRKALQRLNLSSNTFYHSPRRASKSSTNRDTTSTSGFATLEDMPIELRNIEEKRDPSSSSYPASLSHHPHHHAHPTNNHVSAKRSFSGLVNEHETGSTRGDFSAPVSRQNSAPSSSGNRLRRDSGSLFNIIRSHITKPIKSVGINGKGGRNLRRPKDSSKGLKLNGFLSQHRFSLPVNLRRSSRLNRDSNHSQDRYNEDPRSHLLSSQDSTEVSENIVEKDDLTDPIPTDKITNQRRDSVGKINDEANEDADGEEEEDEKIKREIESEKEDTLAMIQSSSSAVYTVLTGNTKRKRELWGKILQKSLSSDSLESKHSKQSRQQSTGTETTITTTTTTTTTGNTSNSASTSESSSKLVAYYSMPELRLLSWSSCDEDDGTDEFGIRLRINRNKPRLSEIHPITFLNYLEPERDKKVIRNDSQDTQTALDDMDHSILEMITASSSGSGGGPITSTTSGSSSVSFCPPLPTIPCPLPPPLPPPPISLREPSTSEAPSPVPIVGRPYGNSSDDGLSPPVSRIKERLQLNLPSASARSPSECSSYEGYDRSEKDSKTVRSLSVEYKPQICSSYRQGLRRFSASPSLLVSKPFFQLAPHTSGHETHPSVDSEESFVTIIPANRSCRGSGTIEASVNDEVDSFMDDVILDIDAASLASTEEDEALCEQLGRPSNETDRVGSAAGVGCESDDPTSASTVTTKSLASIDSSCSKIEDEDEDEVDAGQQKSTGSTPSPPANLHRYFHLFKCGELEEVIEQNVKNLHVVKSYYSEHATSWCVVAEKVQVWTI